MKSTTALVLFAFPLAVLASAGGCVGDDAATGGGGTTSPEGGTPDGATTAKLPSAPQSVTAVADLPGGATVSFKAPVDGAPISKYTIRGVPGGASLDVAGTATSGVFENLAAGTAYTFTVSATNAAGEGPPSAASVPVTIVTAPAVPGKPTACAANGQAFVYVPLAPGATGYNIYTSTTAGGAKPGGTKVTATAPGRTSVPLANGTQHYIAITSTLGKVESQPSPEIRVTPKAFTAVADMLFVASLVNNSIEIYDSYSTTGGDTPARILSGPGTTIASPTYGSVYAAKATGELYVTSSTGNRVDVFADAAALVADVAPVRSLSGGATSISVPSGIVVDSTRNVLYVANRTDGIRRWDDACNVTGDAAPSGILAPAEYVAIDRSLALDEKNDRLYVANENNVIVFDGASTKTGTGSPTKTFTVGATTVGKRGVAYDGVNDILYVASRDEAPSGAVFSFAGASALTSGAPAAAYKMQTPDTGQAMTIQVVSNRLFLVRDSGTSVLRWNDAKNASTIARSGATTPQAGIFYTGFSYVP